MSNRKPYVHSNYDRRKDDHYPTIDHRCIYGLLEHIQPAGLCIDVCAPSGSGIKDALLECQYFTVGLSDALQYEAINGGWIITNPPYTRPLVDQIITRSIDRIRAGEVEGAAFLLRTNFDHAKSRRHIFGACPFYAGQIKLCFRPYWSEERKAQPIHNYVWHIWQREREGPPFVFYSSPAPLPPPSLPLES